jgi:hypothetical protein
LVNEEFIGPFASWANVKTSYGAKGDGVSDDTNALQAAINSLGNANSVIYLPAGKYRITSTLNLTNQQQVAIIGADPSTTSLVWGGSSGGTMLTVSGVAMSRFNRLTFDGQGQAQIAVNQSWPNSGSGYFDTGNHYEDDVFLNTQIGIYGGFLGWGFAETSILRDQFINNTTAGVATGNWNALDTWIRNSYFSGNGYAITNALTASG